MLYSPKNAFHFIVATAVLHNIRRGLYLQEDEDFEVQPDPDLFDFDKDVNSGAPAHANTKYSYEGSIKTW